MIEHIVIPLFVAFFTCVIIGPKVIAILTKQKMKQTVREEGVEAHLKKSGTPTMGGIMILISLFLGSMFYIFRYPEIIPILILTFGFGVIGFIDDYLKAIKKHSDGLKALQKMILQILVTAAFAVYLTFFTNISLEMLIPFSGGRMIDIGWFAYVVMFLAVIGTVNGTNFTDGLDGLATSVTVIVAVFFTIVSYFSWLLPRPLPSDVFSCWGATVIFVYPLTAAMVGALLGFLIFNSYPAKIFMGDTGSLALGGFVIGTAYVMQMPLFVLIIGLVYVVEVLSVMIQVVYFKKTGGKRVFKMTPIHHHFELDSEKISYTPVMNFPKRAWSETRIVTVFTIITVLFCLIAIMGLAWWN